MEAFKKYLKYKSDELHMGGVMKEGAVSGVTQTLCFWIDVSIQ